MLQILLDCPLLATGATETFPKLCHILLNLPTLLFCLVLLVFCLLLRFCVVFSFISFCFLTADRTLACLNTRKITRVHLSWEKHRELLSTSLSAPKELVPNLRDDLLGHARFWDLAQRKQVSRTCLIIRLPNLKNFPGPVEARNVANNNTRNRSTVHYS